MLLTAFLLKASRQVPGKKILHDPLLENLTFVSLLCRICVYYVSSQCLLVYFAISQLHKKLPVNHKQPESYISDK